MNRNELETIRSYLLPGLWGKFGEYLNIDADIEIDEVNKALIVTGFNKDTKKDLAFAITENSIIDGTYKTSFGPSLSQLLELLQ